MSYWRLGDTGATAVDETGLADGIYQNTPTSVPGLLLTSADKAMDFDAASSEHVSGLGAVGDYSFIQNTGVFSIEAIIQLRSTPASTQYDIIANTPASAEKGFFFTWENIVGTNTLRLAVAKGGAPFAVDAQAASNAIADTNPHHVVVTGDGSNVRFYVDGVQSGTATAIGTLSTGDSTRVANIGRYPYSTPGGYFDGIIDEVAIYDSQLVEADVIRHWAAGGRA